VALPEPTIVASRPAMVKTCPSLFVRVWKNLTSLSIVLVVQLSTWHISSSVGQPPVTICRIAVAPFSCSVEELLITCCKVKFGDK
jgi:hypothetical protein